MTDMLSCCVPAALHRNMEKFGGPKTFILISTVMTWALSRPVDAVSGRV